MEVSREVLKLIIVRAEWFRRDQERYTNAHEDQRARERGLQAVTLEILHKDLKERSDEHKLNIKIKQP